MADDQDQTGNTGQDDAKSLEMRVAELEDRLAKMVITDDDMKAFEKVSRLIPNAGCVNECDIQPIIRRPPTIFNPIIRWPIISDPIIRPIIVDQCFECGGGAPGGGFVGGGFEQLGG